MFKYLITGGEGFIGSTIVKITDGFSYDKKSGLDILDKEKLCTYLKGVLGVFHCAAKISVPESFDKKDEYYKTNVIGLKNIIECTKDINLKIVFSSSAAIYGDYDRAVVEDDNPNPMSPYAQNKIDGEAMLRNSGLNSVCLRYFNVYGPGQSKEYAGVITNFIQRALLDQDIMINGDGNQVRDFIYVDDVARANLLAMEYDKSPYEIFNIGSSEEIKIIDLARTIVSLTKSKSKIIHASARDGDIYYSRADTTKAKKLLGFEPSVSLEDGLIRTIDYISK